MNPEKTPELTAHALMALRTENDALRVITERLKVKEMGPADHIRTKHEVKTFIVTGDEAAAETLIRRARERCTVELKMAAKIGQTRRQSI